MELTGVEERGPVGLDTEVGEARVPAGRDDGEQTRVAHLEHELALLLRAQHTVLLSRNHDEQQHPPKTTFLFST